MRLTQSGRVFRSRWAITTVHPASLGTIAILIDPGHSENADSFSRKIQIRSVFEILFLATKNPLKRHRALEQGRKTIQLGARFDLTTQPYPCFSRSDPVLMP